MSPFTPTELAHLDEIAARRVRDDEEYRRNQPQPATERALRDFRQRIEDHFTETQRRDRALFEARLRANRLRQLPTCFMPLDDGPEAA